MSFRHICLALLLLSGTFSNSLAVAQTPVQISPFKDRVVYPERFAPATVISLNEPAISSQISAEVTAIPVRVGDRMARGETLIQLDCAQYQLVLNAAEASVSSSEARLKLAQSQFERAESLIEDNLISFQDFDLRQTELLAVTAENQAAMANRDIAKLNVSRCNVVAPFDLLVIERLVSVGQLAPLGKPLVQVLDTQSLEVSAQVVTEDAALIDANTHFEFSFSSDRVPVALESVVGAIDSRNRNREARLSFVDEQVLPGTSGKIYWRDPRPHIPPQYLVERNQQLGFFVVENSRARFIEVRNAQQGRLNPIPAESMGSLVIEGFAGLRDGDSVSVVRE